MKELRETYFSIQATLFPVLEDEKIEISGKIKEFVELIETVKPARFLNSLLFWTGLGRPMKNREAIIRALMLKHVYNLPTTKVLIETLKSSLSLCRLCGWDSTHQVPSEATFSRTFKILAETQLLSVMHEAVVRENYTDKLVGHASTDSTEIIGREKVCRIVEKKPKIKKKRGRKSRAEREAMTAEEIAAEIAEVSTSRLELQPKRSLEENLADLPQGCDWGCKRNSKGKTERWCGYKLHITAGDGDVPLSAVLTSASLHDSQVAVPMMQMTSQRVTYFYDLMDAAYDAAKVKEASKQMGHIPIIDPNPRRGTTLPLEPAKERRYDERTSVERVNSNLKDNYGGRNVRVKGHWKVLCHLMFGILAITVKQLFNMLV